MLRSLWKFIRDGENRQILSWLGGGVVIIVPGIWAALNYFFPHADNKPAAGPTAAITQSASGIASGRDTVINAPVAIGLDEQQIQLRIAAAQKPLTDQFEKLAAQVAREKGVEVAPLRAILVKLGEAGVADQDVAKRLDQKADELRKSMSFAAAVHRWRHSRKPLKPSSTPAISTALVPSLHSWTTFAVPEIF